MAEIGGNNIAPHTYAALRRGVKETFIAGQQHAEGARVRTYWQTGQLIDQHLLIHQDRASYGAEVFPRLSGDAGISVAVLYRCLQFRRAFPILAARRELTWAHYRLLLQIQNPTERKAIELKAASNGWTSRELEFQVQSVVPEEAPIRRNGDKAVSGGRPLVPKRGTVGVYQLAAQPDGLAVDFGFTLYQTLTPRQARGKREGQLVTFRPSGEIGSATGAALSHLYTYRAEILRVVDGDTVWMKIHLSNGLWLKEKLRLRGVDCAELERQEESETRPGENEKSIARPSGRAARQFVQSIANRASSVIITTTKPDKWDRYLSDVYVTTDSGDEIYLNNVLIELGYAVRKTTYALEDWAKADSVKPRW